MALADLQNKRAEFFKQRRGEVNQDAQNQLQEGSDALNRRFTSLGMSGSGAAIGADLKNRDAVAASKAKALSDVQGQELQANEGDIGREFQGAEAQKGRDFSGGLAAADSAQRQKFFDVEQGNKLTQIDLAKKQFDMDKDAYDFNKRMAEIAAGYEAPEPGKSGGQQLIEGVTNTARDASIGSIIGGAPLAIAKELGIKIDAPKCFFTTAACGSMGLEDDCWVLESARNFRDTFMLENKDRAIQVSDYYEFAPKIVEEINKDENSNKIWKKLFWTRIVPFASDVTDGNNEIAYKKYLDLISYLKNKYLKDGV